MSDNPTTPTMPHVAMPITLFYTIEPDNRLCVFYPLYHWSPIVHVFMMKIGAIDHMSYGGYMAYDYGQLSLDSLKFPANWSLELWQI